MIPSPPGSGVTTLAFFHDHQDAVTVSSFFQFAASVQMAIYAAMVSSRLHVRLQDGRAETVWS